MGKYDYLSDSDIMESVKSCGSRKKAAKALHIPYSSFKELWHARFDKPKSKINKNNVYKVGVISDLHYGSIYSCPEHVQTFVEHCSDEGVSQVLIAGDISDGIFMRKGQETEIFLHGVDEIISYIAETLPIVDGIEYYGITGNHCNSLVKHCGVDLGFALAKERSDFHYLGYTRSRITLEGGVLGYLYHGSGSCTVNRSARLQKKVQQISEECINSKMPLPECYFLGHCHHNSVIYGYFGSLAVSLGCFQKTTPYLAEKGLIPDISGIILEYVADGQGLIKTPKIEYCKYE